jgi:hypothetical protein
MTLRKDTVVVGVPQLIYEDFPVRVTCAAADYWDIWGESW